MDNQEVFQPSKAEPRFYYGYTVVLAAFVIMVMSWCTYASSFGVFFKPLLAEFGWTRAVTSGAFSVSMITQGFLGIIVGRLNDRLGPRVVMTLCGVFLGAGYLLMSQISTVWQLYLFYGVIIGAGMSCTLVPLLSTTVRWFTRRRSAMSGVVLTGMGIGSLIAPPVADWLVSAYDWHVSYILFGCVALIFTVIAAQFLRRDPSHIRETLHRDIKRAEPSLTLDSAGLSFRGQLAP